MRSCISSIDSIIASLSSSINISAPAASSDTSTPLQSNGWAHAKSIRLNLYSQACDGYDTAAGDDTSDVDDGDSDDHDDQSDDDD